MASIPDSIRKWLKQVLIPVSTIAFILSDLALIAVHLLQYPARDHAFSQVLATLEAYPTLLPKTESFTFDDGRTALLVSLSGTIPVDYRGSRYNIPIAVWLPFEYPSDPPIVYVTPTQDMVIKKGVHIEPGGKCIGGYLDSWLSKSEACSLKCLLEFLQDVFSREPPLYSKPKPSTPIYTSQPHPPAPSTSRLPTNSSQLPIRPPLPPQLTRSVSTNSSVHRDSHLRPLPPTRPPLPPPLYSQSSSATSTSNAIHPLNPLDLRSNSTPVDATQQASLSAPSFNPGSLTGAQIEHGHHSQQPIHADVQSHDYRRSVSSYGTLPAGVPTNAMARPIEQHFGSLIITEKHPNVNHPTPNLLDDPLEDNEPRRGKSPANVPPPPRPPNPELLSLRQSVHSQLISEFDRLRASLEVEKQQLEILETDLLKGEPAILDELARLEAVKDVCVNVGGRYRELVQQLKSRVAELKNRKIVDADELVCSTTVLYNQLWELVINDKVIDDLIYNLSRALNNHLDGPKIDLEKFLKRVRILGHEQFVARLMINQICQQLGISPSALSSSSHPTS